MFLFFSLYMQVISSAIKDRCCVLGLAVLHCIGIVCWWYQPVDGFRVFKLKPSGESRKELQQQHLDVCTLIRIESHLVRHSSSKAYLLEISGSYFESINLSQDQIIGFPVLSDQPK